MSREAIISALVMAVVVLTLVAAFMPKARFYYVLYYIASIVMLLGLLGAFVSVAAQCLFWLRFDVWPEWSLLPQPPPLTGFVGLDRILADLSKGPPFAQLAIVWFVGFVASWWFERKMNQAEEKE